MPGWELHDGNRKTRAMSEQAVLHAIARGLDSSAKVRPEGQEVWLALDDHEPFADALVQRSQRDANQTKRGGLTAYTWAELGRVALALVVLVGAVVLVDRLGPEAMPYWERVKAYWTAASAPSSSSAVAELSPGAIRQAEIASSIASVPPKTRASMALSLLDDPKVDRRKAVCTSRAYLDTLPEEQRTLQEVKNARSHLSSTELPLLHAERAEFEKTRGVICGDGTKPKNCRCGAAHESCCANHKGVQGCEPLPSRIRCDRAEDF